MNTPYRRPETFVPLSHGIIDDTSSQAMPDLRRTLPQFIDVMNFMSFSSHSVITLQTDCFYYLLTTSLGNSGLC